VNPLCGAGQMWQNRAEEPTEKTGEKTHRWHPVGDHRVGSGAGINKLKREAHRAVLSKIGGIEGVGDLKNGAPLIFRDIDM